LVEGQRRAHSAWTAQRVVDAFPDDFVPSYLPSRSRQHL